MARARRPRGVHVVRNADHVQRGDPSLAAANADGEIYVSGAATGGLRVFRSADGSSWQSSGVIDPAVRADDPSCPNVRIFALGGDVVGVTYDDEAGEGYVPSVAVSTDGGATFRASSLPNAGLAGPSSGGARSAPSSTSSTRSTRAWSERR